MEIFCGGSSRSGSYAYTSTPDTATWTCYANYDCQRLTANWNVGVVHYY
jgi:hypothetical protein